MSKDFEQAYRELAEREIPDLWDRIEAGLESRTTPARIQESEAGTAKKQLKKIKWMRFNRYSGIAAAAVCVAVVIPAAVFLWRSGNRAFSDGGSGGARLTEDIDMAAAQNEAMEFIADEAEAVAEESVAAAGESAEAVEESADVAEETAGTADAGQAEEGVQEAATEDMDGGGETDALDELTVKKSEDKALSDKEDASQMRDTADELEEEGGSPDTGAGGIRNNQSQSGGWESAKQEAAIPKAEEEKATDAGEVAKGTVFEKVEIKVTGVENDFDREDGSIPGTFYSVVVWKDGSGKLEEGEELVVDLPAYASYALAKDSVYEVDLVYKGNGIYELDQYHRRVEE